MAATEVTAAGEAAAPYEAMAAIVVATPAAEAEADAEIRGHHRRRHVCGAVRIRVDVIAVRIIAGIGRHCVWVCRANANSEAHLRRGRSCRGNGCATSHGRADSEFCDRSHDTFPSGLTPCIRRPITHLTNIGGGGLGSINALFIAR